MAKFAAKDSNKNITLSPHGTGKVVVGTGATDATVQSDGNHNLVLQTGNSTTGSITITDGADGNIDITPNGTGEVNITKADIDAGNISGTDIDVSSNTLTTSSAQKTAIVDGGKGNLTKSDVGLSNVTNDAQVPASGGNFTGDVKIGGSGTPARKLEVSGSHIRVDDGYGLEGSGSSEKFVINNGFLTFFTNLAERMRIVSTGNVGIGVSDPETPLAFEPSDVTTATEGIKFQNSSSTTDAIIQPHKFSSGIGVVVGANAYINTSGNIDRFNSSEESSAIQVDPRGRIFVITGGTGGSPTTRLEIDSAGSITTPNGEFNGTIGSSATFPAGSLIDYDLVNITSTINVAATGGTPAISSTTAISITLPAGSTAIMTAHGGRIFLSSGTTRRASTCVISYTTDGTTPSASSNLIYGGEATLVSPSGTAYAPGIVEGEVTNSTASDVTLKWNWGVVGTGSLNGDWQTETSGRASLSLKTLIFKD